MCVCYLKQKQTKKNVISFSSLQKNKTEKKKILRNLQIFYILYTILD